MFGEEVSRCVASLLSYFLYIFNCISFLDCIYFFYFFPHFISSRLGVYFSFLGSLTFDGFVLKCSKWHLRQKIKCQFVTFIIKIFITFTSKCMKEHIVIKTRAINILQCSICEWKPDGVCDWEGVIS